MRTRLLLSALLLVAGCRAQEHAPQAGPVQEESPSVAITPEQGTEAVDAPAVSQPTAAAARPIAGDAAPAKLAVVVLSPSLRVDRAASQVEVDGFISLDAGALEQIACARGTREHESIFVPEPRPSEIHAALLLAGFEPGAPGQWRFTADGTLELIDPTGDEIEVLLRHGDGAFEPIARFVRDGRSAAPFPDRPFVFAGSRLAPNPPSFGPGTHYVADYTGSVVGLVTFGDEMIAWREVIPDREEVAAPVWQANPLRLPAPGTSATLLLRRPAPSSR